jgi:hypothetical protein
MITKKMMKPDETTLMRDNSGAVVLKDDSGLKGDGTGA